MFDTQNNKEESANATATTTSNTSDQLLSSSSSTNKPTSDTLLTSDASKVKRKNNDSEKNLSGTNSSVTIIDGESEQIEINNLIESSNENVDLPGTVENKAKEVSMDEILEQWQKLTVEFVGAAEDVANKVGGGTFGAVTEAFATFTRLVSQMAEEPRDHLKVKIVAKGDKGFDAEQQEFTDETHIPFVKNEVLINYVLTQYITRNYSNIADNQELKTCFRGIPLLILSEEQNDLLSGAQNCDELVQIVQDNIEKFGRIYLESKENQDFDTHLLKNKEYSAIKELFKQALMQLAFLNHLGIAHRDIKPENMRINTDNNTLSLLDFGTSYLGLDTAKKFYENENAITETKQIYGAPPEAYENPYKLNPIAENEFGFGALLLMMLFPLDGSRIIAKYCNPEKKQESIISEIEDKFDKICQDEYFKENFATQEENKPQGKKRRNESDPDGIRFFNNTSFNANSKSCSKGLKAASKLKTKLSESSSSGDPKVQALLKKIEEFEAAVSEENKEFLKLCEKNTDKNNKLDILSPDFDQMKIEGWKKLYNDIEKIVKNPEEILNKEKVSKNYTKEDQDKIIELLKGFLNPDPQKRLTCEGALQEYFSTTLDFSDLPKLENFDIFNTQKRNKLAQSRIDNLTQLISYNQQASSHNAFDTNNAHLVDIDGKEVTKEEIESIFKKSIPENLEIDTSELLNSQDTRDITMVRTIVARSLITKGIEPLPSKELEDIARIILHQPTSTDTSKSMAQETLIPYIKEGLEEKKPKSSLLSELEEKVKASEGKDKKAQRKIKRAISKKRSKQNLPPQDP